MWCDCCRPIQREESRSPCQPILLTSNGSSSAHAPRRPGSPTRREPRTSGSVGSSTWRARSPSAERLECNRCPASRLHSRSLGVRPGFGELSLPGPRCRSWPVVHGSPRRNPGLGIGRRGVYRWKGAMPCRRSGDRDGPELEVADDIRGGGASHGRGRRVSPGGGASGERMHGARGLPGALVTLLQPLLEGAARAGAGAGAPGLPTAGSLCRLQRGAAAVSRAPRPALHAALGSGAAGGQPARSAHEQPASHGPGVPGRGLPATRFLHLGPQRKVPARMALGRRSAQPVRRRRASHARRHAPDHPPLPGAGPRGR